MPGGAAHTYGIAFTGRLAVYAGVNDARCRLGSGRRARRRTGRRHVRGCASPSGAGPTPAAPPAAVPGRRETHDLGAVAAPDSVERCAAMDPAASSPARIDVSRRAAATSPVQVQSLTGRAAASASAASGGANSVRRYEDRLASNEATGWPNPISSNSRCGESRRDRFANSSISTESHATLHGKQREWKCVGGEPGLLPVAYIDDPPRADAESTCARRSSPSWCPPPKRLAPSRDDVPPDSSSPTTSSRCNERGMYSKQSGPRARTARRSVVASTPTGSSPQSVPASRPCFAGSYTSTPTSSRSGCRDHLA